MATLLEKRQNINSKQERVDEQVDHHSLSIIFTEQIDYSLM